MMMRKMGRRRRSGRKTSPCSPSSARRLEVTSKTRPTRHTASSMIGGWRVSTHCDDNTTQHWTCTHIQKSFHIQPLAQMWRNLMKHLMFRSPVCACFFVCLFVFFKHKRYVENSFCSLRFKNIHHTPQRSKKTFLASVAIFNNNTALYWIHGKVHSNVTWPLTDPSTTWTLMFWWSTLDS